MTDQQIATQEPDGTGDAKEVADGPNPADPTVGAEGTANPSATSDRSAWLEWRGQGIGASDVAGILGLSPWNSPWSIWAEKVGLSPGQDETKAMRFGKMMEPVLRQMFEQETGLWVLGEQTWCQHPDEPWMRCTVDGFAFESHGGSDDLDSALGVYEAKTTSEPPWDEVPVHYQCQASWAMAVTNQPVCWFGVLHMAFGRPDFHVYEFKRNEADITTLIDRCRAFWFDHVVAGAAPSADAHKATTEALATAWDADDEATVEAGVRLVDMVHELRSLKDEAKRVDVDVTAIENELKAALGEATALVDGGKTLCTWKAQDRTSLDTKALRAELPDIAEKYTNTTTSRVLRLKTTKGD